MAKKQASFEEGDCLGYEQFEGRGVVFVNCFDLEIEKSGPTISERVLDFCSKAFLEVKLHTLFTEAGLALYTERVFMDADIRDFILSLADRFAIMGGLGDIDDLHVERTIATGIHQATEHGVQNTLDKVPAQVSSNMQRNGQTIFDLLRTNRWLVVMVFICMYFSKTKQYQPDPATPTPRRTSSQSQANSQ